MRLGGLLNLSVAQARGANALALGASLDRHAYGLEINVPATVRHVVRMADPMPEHGATPADFTNFSHVKEFSWRATNRQSTNELRSLATMDAA